MKMCFFINKRVAIAICLSVLLYADTYANDTITQYNDLQSKTTAELRLLRNDIFARHGYMFKSADLSEYYSKQPWYKIDKNFTEKMLSQSEKNTVNVIRELEKTKTTKTAVTASQFDPTRFTDKFRNEIDMNGDGKNEIISVRDERKGEQRGTYLYINEDKVSQIAWNPYNFYKIIDIDEKDKYKEIETYYYGFNNNNVIKIIAFDGKQVIAMATIDNSWNILADGKGYVKGAFHGKLLKDVLFRKIYKIDKNHTLVKLNADNEIYDLDMEARMKTALDLQRSPIDESVSCSLKKGDKVKIVGTDNKEWCLVERADGGKGWFAVEDFIVVKKLEKVASEVFEGLYKEEGIVDDLNGDGVNDVIYVIPGYDQSFYIIINDVYKKEYDRPKIVDVDSKDGFKELACLSEDLFNSSYNTTRFYYYNGSKIADMGGVGGELGYGVEVDGSGEVKAEKISGKLQNINFKTKLRLNENRTFVEVQEEFYRLESEVYVKALKKLILKKSPDDHTLSYMLQPGQEVAIVYGNEDGWFAVKNESGRIGWFKVNSYDTIEGVEESAQLYFEGLRQGP